ncbi:LapA family protein [[Limnothrix rosea] IAM M-220]|uniref:LapA family protein n=1 Tax=[Limnothrix rosea] IAM M-220 TaxID=454133 RepID=UPI00095CC181|nr:LapA family protein [[Limnothrix rosea] IAM M-220]OKH17360.1 hypothetical protein NIES208_09735 [[Limnothrix rosea] IAM M-220]
MNSRSLTAAVFLLLIGGGSILLLQNSQPLNLVIFNQQLPLTLPLSFWMIFAVIAGIITNLLMQLLLGFEAPKKVDRLNERLENLKQRPPRKPDNRTGRSDWERSRANYDWTDKDVEEEDAETWDIESPPQTPTRPKPPGDRPNPEKIRSNQQKPQRPRPTPDNATERPSRPRRKTSQPPQKKGEGVYDADYRVITPPYSPEEEQSPIPDLDDDGEWI